MEDWWSPKISDHGRPSWLLVCDYWLPYELHSLPTHVVEHCCNISMKQAQEYAHWSSVKGKTVTCVNIYSHRSHYHNFWK